jgi:hypothetical protein
MAGYYGLALPTIEAQYIVGSIEAQPTIFTTYCTIEAQPTIFYSRSRPTIEAKETYYRTNGDQKGYRKNAS